MTTPIGFPTTTLGIKVELLLNGTWVDISSYVQQRQDITITQRGLPNETQTVQPSQLSLTLNNRSGNFSPKNSAGAFYPFITRNTQIRVSVNAFAGNPINTNTVAFSSSLGDWGPGGGGSGQTTVMTNSLPAGAPYPYALLFTSSATGGGNAFEASHSGTALIQNNTPYTISGWYYCSANNINIVFNWLLNGAFVSSTGINAAVTPNTWTYISKTATSPAAGINQIGPGFDTPGQSSTYTIYGQGVTALSPASMYSGYRFWGEVRAWPPQWDSSGNDVYVTIQANGVLSRYNQGGSIGSPLKRFYLLKNDATTPVALWTMEELTNAAQFGNSIVPGDDMVWTGGPPTLSSCADFEGTDPLPLISLSTITGPTGSFSSSGDDLFTTAGTHTWHCPPGITTVDAQVYGAGGGGGYNARTGGGGGEYAENAAVGVTPGNAYTVVVGAGGQGGVNLSSPGSPGGNSSFTGDSVTVTAHGGGGGDVSGSPGAGGTGSTATIHFNGGTGGGTPGGVNAGGGGGGSSGCATLAGNTGGASSSGVGGTGAAAVGAGGPGGDGGNGSSGGGVQNFVKSYSPSHTYCYEGSDGLGTPNGLINIDGSMVQGGDTADTYNGKAKTWLLFNYAQIASDLSGATITKVTLTLSNQHTWFNSGMTMCLGWDTTTSFPSTKADPTLHPDVSEFSWAEGATKTVTLTTSFGTIFQSSGATSLVLWKNSNILTYYGYFAGGKSPILTIYYQK